MSRRKEERAAAEWEGRRGGWSEEEVWEDQEVCAAAAAAAGGETERLRNLAARLGCVGGRGRDLASKLFMAQRLAIVHEPAESSRCLVRCAAPPLPHPPSHHLTLTHTIVSVLWSRLPLSAGLDAC